jgi:hypothetical protein
MMRKLWAKIWLLVFILGNLLPLSALAAGNTPPPQEPYEKVAAKKGEWYTDRITYDNMSHLVVGYKGSHELHPDQPVLEFSLKEKTLLTSICIPYQGRVEEEITLMLQAENGNVYQGFTATAQSTGTIHMAEEAPREGNTIYVFTPENNLLLPRDTYTLYLDGSVLPVDAFLIKGYNYAAYERYQEDLVEWAREEEKSGAGEAKEVAGEAEKAGDDTEEAYVSFGNEELRASYDRFIEGITPKETPLWSENPKKGVVPQFALAREHQIDEVIFSTWNNGEGVHPGVITIRDENNREVASFRSQGASQGAANTLWVAQPGITLPRGVYTLELDPPGVLDFDETGAPAFYVGTSVPVAAPFNYSGTYKIWLDVYKTKTLAGLADSGKVSFDLNDFELTVLDKGSVIELIAQYEGMPFSQNCEVIERDEKSLKAVFYLTVDLTKLGNNGKIGAQAEVTLSQGNAGRVDITLGGTALYTREATAEKGGDQNSYDLAMRGNMVKKDLPPFVTAAIAKTYGTGNIPGPDSPAQAAAGMLFPPLVGLVISTLQSLTKPKELVSNLSVGEQAMKEANRSLGKGLYTPEEARAWATMADALGASGGDPEDAVSIGDNEKPGGEDYVAPKESSFGGSDEYDEYEEWEQEESQADQYSPEDYGYNQPIPSEQVFSSEREQLEAERDEWLGHLKSSLASADPNDPRTAELHKEYEDYIKSLNERIDSLAAAEKAAREAATRQTMTVQVDHTGRTAEIEYDPETDSWINIETGNEFNMEIYKKDVVPNFTRDKEFIEEQRRKLEAGDTAMDRALREFTAQEKERERLLGQLQKLRNNSYGVIPPAEGVGDVQANIDRLMNELSDRKVPLDQIREQAGHIARLVSNRTTGVTISEEMGKWIRERELANADISAIKEGYQDVIQSRTWAGMAGRIALAGVTGGLSEYVLSPVEALIDIKDGMDQGDSGASATLKAIGKYVVGEFAGEGVSRGAGKAWKASGIGDTKLVKGLAEWGNTPVGEVMDKALGRGAYSGSKELVENTASRVGKQALGAADGSMSKAAADAAEYAKYRASVKEQANIIESKLRNAAPNRPLTPEDVHKALSTDDLRKVLQDPSVTRELKNADPGIQKAFKETLDNKLYKPANQATAKELQENMLKDIQKEFGPNAKIKNVEIDSIRTPDPHGKASPLNADNDITGKVTIEVDGKTISREIPAKDVAPIYNNNFAEASGMMKDGKFDVAKAKAEMPEGISVIDEKGVKRNIPWEEATEQQRIDAFAQKHNQEVTDAFSTEAAVDFNATRNADGVSNVAKLKAGDPTAALADPGGLANMEATKINNFMNKGGISNQTEAYEQLAKMGKLTDDLTNAYQKLGYPAQDLPVDMQKALDIVKDRSLSPGTRTLKLQELNFKGPEDLANKLSARIEGLQKLEAPKDADNPMLSKMCSIIVGSYLNDKKK